MYIVNKERDQSEKEVLNVMMMTANVKFVKNVF